MADTVPPSSSGWEENLGGGVFSTPPGARDLVNLRLGLSLVVSFSLDADGEGTPKGDDLCAPNPNAGAGDGDPSAPKGPGDGTLLGDAPPAMENVRPISGGFNPAGTTAWANTDGLPPTDVSPAPAPNDPPIAPISCAPVAIARGFSRTAEPGTGEAAWSDPDAVTMAPAGSAVDVGPGAKFQVAHRVSHMRHVMMLPARLLPATGDVPASDSAAASQPHNARSVAVSAAAPAPSTSSSMRFAAPGGAPTCVPVLFNVPVPGVDDPPPTPAPSSMAAAVVVFGS